MSVGCGFRAFVALLFAAAATAASAPLAMTAGEAAPTDSVAHVYPKHSPGWQLDPVRTVYADDDCNDNGILDREDLKAGIASDMNHNGVVDECDADTLVAHILEGGWEAFASRDTLYAYVLYFKPDSLMAVHYTVFRLSRVQITHTLKNAQTRTLVDTMQTPGAYVAEWRPVDRSGKRLSSGECGITVKVGKHRQQLRAAWRF